MYCVHRQREQELVFDHCVQRERIVLNVHHFPDLTPPFGFPLGMDDEDIDLHSQDQIQWLETALASQLHRGFQSPSDGGETRVVPPEFQIHPYRPLDAVDGTGEALQTVHRERAAQTLSPGCERAGMAGSGKHKPLIVLRARMRCQSCGIAARGRSRLHFAPRPNTDLAGVDLILASSSVHRRALLSRLGLRFDTISPDIDEAPLSGETPREMAERLSRLKAEAVTSLRPRALIVGSDQVAVLGDRILRKPGGHGANVRQLMLAAGRTVHFLTGVALLNAASGALQCEVVEFRVRLRSFGEKQAEDYVRIERAYDCAGGFRAEGLGITLIERMEGADPTSLVGLPLITLVSMLRREGVDPLSGCRQCRRLSPTLY